MKKIIVCFFLLISIKSFAVDSTVTTIGQEPPNLTASLDGSILTVASGDLGNADTSYTYFDLLKAGFNAFSLQYTITATTLTVEFSNDIPTVTNANASWTDGTSVATDGAATSITATGALTTMGPLPWSRVRIKRVTTAATNSLSLYLTRMRRN